MGDTQHPHLDERVDVVLHFHDDDEGVTYLQHLNKKPETP